MHILLLFHNRGYDALYIACELIILVNSFVTFVCVVLTYKSMNDVYGKLCGCIDKCYKLKKQRESQREIADLIRSANETDINDNNVNIDQSENEPLV